MEARIKINEIDLAITIIPDYFVQWESYENQMNFQFIIKCIPVKSTS